MTVSESTQVSDMLTRIQTWTAEMRVALARRVLETLESPAISDPPQTLPLEQVIGLLKTGGSAPDDEQCARIVEEERLRKHG